MLGRHPTLPKKKDTLAAAVRPVPAIGSQPSKCLQHPPAHCSSRDLPQCQLALLMPLYLADPVPGKTGRDRYRPPESCRPSLLLDTLLQPSLYLSSYWRSPPAGDDTVLQSKAAISQQAVVPCPALRQQSTEPPRNIRPGHSSHEHWPGSIAPPARRHCVPSLQARTQTGHWPSTPLSHTLGPATSECRCQRDRPQPPVRSAESQHRPCPGHNKPCTAVDEPSHCRAPNLPSHAAKRLLRLRGPVAKDYPPGDDLHVVAATKRVRPKGNKAAGSDISS